MEGSMLIVSVDGIVVIDEILMADDDCVGWLSECWFAISDNEQIEGTQSGTRE